MLTTADLVSTTLEVEDSEHNIIATVNMNWERPSNHKTLDVLEAWVGSRSLGEFEEPDLFQGDIVAFEVRITKHKCCSSASGCGLVKYQRVGRLSTCVWCQHTH